MGVSPAFRTLDLPAIGSPAAHRLDSVSAALMAGPGGLVMLAVGPLVPHHRLMAVAGITAILVGIWAWLTPPSAPMWVRHAYTAVAMPVTVLGTAAGELSTELRLGPTIMLCPVLVIACLRRPRAAIALLTWGIAVYAGYLYSTLPAVAATVGVLGGGIAMLMVASMAIVLRGALDRVVAELRFLAERDPLTGLLNRHGLRLALEACDVEGGSLVLADIDHFKTVNDVYGHEEGDATLVWFSEVLTARLDPAYLCARMGGEEFVVVLPGVGVDLAARWADQLRSAVASESAGRRAPITVSAGVRHGPLRQLSELLRDADAALYRAKSCGRNRVEVAFESVPSHPRPG